MTKKEERQAIFDKTNGRCGYCGCDLKKGSESIDSFRYGLMHSIEVLNRDSTVYRSVKRYGLIKETGVKIVFYFETLNK